MGIVQYHQGRFGRAIEYFEKALARNPHYAEALLYLSVIYCDLGHYDKGKKRGSHLLALPKLKGHLAIASPFRARLSNMHAEIGDLYRGLGCVPEALFEYDRALTLEPGYADIRLKRAICLRMADASNPEAAKELKAVIKTNPAYLQAYLELGITHYLAGQWQEAKAAWQALQKRAPDHKHAQVYLQLLERKKKAGPAPKSKSEDKPRHQDEKHSGKKESAKKKTQHFLNSSDKKANRGPKRAKRK
jgi:tetratricopeptide (TPR) repeat protein